jgi:hypothetical protein
MGVTEMQQPELIRRSNRKGKYAPPVHLIRLTEEEREITPYIWVHPDEER